MANLTPCGHSTVRAADVRTCAVAWPESRDLISLISAAIAAYDPLDPWLVNSNYDEHYWDDIAAALVDPVSRAVSEAEIYEALVAELRPFVRPPEGDDYVRGRIRASAREIWRRLPRS
jgi:hypothetical protein